MNDETYYRLLKQYWGYTSFRPQQLETIRAVCGRNDVLLLMPTGGGKSIVYQIPGLAAEGICIVITPLIALMKDQIDQLRKRHISAVSIHGGMPFRDIDRILDNCVYGDVKFLFIAPERIDSEVFRSRYARMNVSLLAVDEAHCISQWGYDFRPAYLEIGRLRDAHPEVPILALTASATADVADDIMSRLKFRSPYLLRTSFARDNLVYVVRKTEDKSAQLTRILQNVAGSAIVYVRTRDRAESVADFLKRQGFSADFYHGGMNYFTRSERQDAWINDHLRIMVATNAFGMGIDKRDVRLVIHYDLCDSLENYYQESGRAGRDGQKAYAVLLYSEGDVPRIPAATPRLSSAQNHPSNLRIDLQLPEHRHRRREGIGLYVQHLRICRPFPFFRPDGHPCRQDTPAKRLHDIDRRAGQSLPHPLHRNPRRLISHTCRS